MINSITVLMPTYNCGPYLIQAIQSVLNQSFKEFEFLIIDDGSDDGTENIVEDFSDSRIKYIRRVHEGFPASANYGIKISENEFIARMDADDIALPNRLEDQINYLNSHPDYNIISCWYALFRKERVLSIVKTPVKHEDVKEGLALHSVICHPGAIFNKKTITSVGGYLENTREDYHLWLRLKNKARFYNIPEVLMLLRERKNSLSRSSSSENNSLVYEAQQKYYLSGIEVEFNILNRSQINKTKGWREWFYGEKSKARKIWIDNKIINIRNLKIIIAYFLTFLPEQLFLKVKNLRLKDRLIFLLITPLSFRKNLNNILSDYNKMRNY